jgi:tryptophan-rich sensory protein
MGTAHVVHPPVSSLVILLFLLFVIVLTIVVSTVDKVSGAFRVPLAVKLK